MSSRLRAKTQLLLLEPHDLHEMARSQTRNRCSKARAAQPRRWLPRGRYVHGVHLTAAGCVIGRLPLGVDLRLDPHSPVAGANHHLGIQDYHRDRADSEEALASEPGCREARRSPAAILTSARSRCATRTERRDRSGRPFASIRPTCLSRRSRDDVLSPGASS